MIGEGFVGAKDLIGSEGIEPGGDTEAVVVIEGGAGALQQLFGARLGEKRLDFVESRIDQESIGLTVGANAVVSALIATKGLEKFCSDAGALQQGVIGPRGVAVHATEENALVLVGAGAEVLIEDIGMRPDF